MRLTSRKGESLAQLLHKEGISSAKVLAAIAKTPREIFLPDALKHKAYQNTAYWSGTNHIPALHSSSYD
jgi:protein-L-isoaspartate(D-aspartate) O-methyltransferase